MPTQPKKTKPTSDDHTPLIISKFAKKKKKLIHYNSACLFHSIRIFLCKNFTPIIYITLSFW